MIDSRTLELCEALSKIHKQVHQQIPFVANRFHGFNELPADASEADWSEQKSDFENYLAYCDSVFIEVVVLHVIANQYAEYCRNNQLLFPFPITPDLKQDLYSYLERKIGYIIETAKAKVRILGDNVDVEKINNSLETKLPTIVDNLLEGRSLKLTDDDEVDINAQKMVSLFMGILVEKDFLHISNNKKMTT